MKPDPQELQEMLESIPEDGKPLLLHQIGRLSELSERADDPDEKSLRKILSIVCHMAEVDRDRAPTQLLISVAALDLFWLAVQKSSHDGSPPVVSTLREEDTHSVQAQIKGAARVLQEQGFLPSELSFSSPGEGAEGVVVGFPRKPGGKKLRKIHLEPLRNFSPNPVPPPGADSGEGIEEEESSDFTHPGGEA